MASQADRYETIIRVAEDDDRSAGDTLIEIIKDMDARLSFTEEQSYSISEFENQLKTYGQEKVNTLLLPTYQQIRMKADLGSILSATTLSQLSAATGQQTCVISPEAAWPMFAPTQYMTFNAVDNPNLQLFAEKVSYDKTTGVLIFNVKSFIGSGIGIGWNIAVAAQMLPASAMVITPTANIAGPTLQTGLQQISNQLGLIPFKADSSNSVLTGASQAQDLSVVSSLASPFRVIRDTGADQVSAEFKTPITGSMFLGFSGNTLRVSTTNNLSAGVDVSLKGHTHSISEITSLQANLDLKSNALNPAFTGVGVMTATSSAPWRIVRTVNDIVSIEYNTSVSGARFFGFSAGKPQIGPTAALGTNICLLDTNGRIDASAQRIKPFVYLEQTTVRTVSTTTQSILSAAFDYVTSTSTTSNVLALLCLSGSITGNSNAADDYSYSFDVKRFDGSAYVTMGHTATYGDINTNSIAASRQQNFVHTLRPIILTRAHSRSNNPSQWAIQIQGSPDYPNFVLSTIKASVIFIEFEP